MCECESYFEPEPEEIQPEPCEYCSLIAGVYMEHDGRCDEMTKEQYNELIGK